MWCFRKYRVHASACSRRASLAGFPPEGGTPNDWRIPDYLKIAVLYLNKIGLQKLQKHARSKCAVLQKLQKHARSKCAVFAPLLRAGFRNFFANHFPFGIVTFFKINLQSSITNYEIERGHYL
jgi:hypothetical protein